MGVLTPLSAHAWPALLIPPSTPAEIFWQTYVKKTVPQKNVLPHAKYYPKIRQRLDWYYQEITWDYTKITMRIPSDCLKILQRLHFYYQENPPMPSEYIAITQDNPQITLILLWDYNEITMRLPWDYNEITLRLPESTQRLP